jgi:two-component system, NtrC family, sensor histidine kinase HydH
MASPHRAIVSPPIGAGHSYLAFGRGVAGGAVALLVDRDYLLDGFRVPAHRIDTRLFVLEPDNRLAQRFDGNPVPVRTDWFGMTGSRQIDLDADEAVDYGLPARGAVLALASSPRRDGPSWVVGVAVSMRVVDAERNRLITRFGLGSLVTLLALVAFGRFLVRQQRREAELRERLRVATQLAHLAEKAEKVVASIPEPVALLGSNGEVTSTNRAFDAQNGGPRTGPLAAALPHARAEMVAQLQAALEVAKLSGKPKTLPAVHCALFAEREGHYSFHIVPLQQPAPDAAFLLVIEDHSNLYDLESQLIRAEKLATVGVLAAGIAHEVGTPLGIIRGRAQHLLKKLPAEDVAAPALRTIVEQIDRVTRTIRQLLDFSRRRPAVQPGAVELGPVVAAVVELTRHRFDEGGMDLEVAIAGDVPPVAADADQLQQVILNLLMNARDACVEGGHVRLRATYDRQDWERVTIEISDNGVGIAASDQQAVFDPFYTTKQQGEGTGLGLTIAADLVKAHGGQIHLASQPGRGTTVTIRWPIAAPRTVAHA